MGEAGLDDVFTDDITVPAADGYKLAATLFLPRGAKRHAVLINSATATPRKIYRGFAGYLARRGCAVLTYDYRGIGGSRQRAVEGYNQPKSLVGFKASMSDWATLDATAAVNWMCERYHNLPLGYVGHSFGGQALGLLANNIEVSRALLIAAQAAYWKLMASPERYREHMAELAEHEALRMNALHILRRQAENNLWSSFRLHAACATLGALRC